MHGLDSSSAVEHSTALNTAALLAAAAALGNCSRHLPGAVVVRSCCSRTTLSNAAVALARTVVAFTDSSQRALQCCCAVLSIQYKLCTKQGR